MKKIIILFILIIGIQGASVPAWGARPRPTGDTVMIRHKLESILTDSRFNYPDHFEGLRRLISRLQQWLVKQFQPRRPGTAGWLDRSLETLGLVLVIGSPLLILLLMRRFFLRDSQIKLASASRQYDPSANWQSVVANAGQTADLGDFRAAIRQLYLAALFRLRGTGSLPEGVRYSSDKENLRTLGKKVGFDSPVYHSFAALVRLFREKWYGFTGCDASDYREANRIFETLNSHVKKPPR
jgi:hypothetical protein